jgi:hypothetical protein
MIRTLLATTALAAMLATGAIAQETVPAAPAEPAAPNQVETTLDNAADAVENATDAAADAVQDAAESAQAAVHDATAREPWDISAGYVVADTDNLGTRLIGQPVYSSTGEDAEEIGKISDIVFNDRGEIVAAVIGVGGFLGIGEKSVAVDFLSLDFTIAADNTERWVLPTTADALTAAPDFVWREDEPADVDTMAPAAPADAMAPAAPATN